MKFIDIGIIHSNDMHSHMENFAKKASIIKEIKENNKKYNIKTLVLDSGDLFAGSIYFNLYGGTKEIELMNIIKCDAMTLGNHEFDHGDDLLSRLGDFAKFPILSSNVKYINNDLKNELVDIKDYIEIRLDNHTSLGIIGVTTLDTDEVSSPSKNIIFDDPISSIKRSLKELKLKDKNKHFILLSHLGYDNDLLIAEKFPELNVILGGHTHTIIKKPHYINKSIVLQAGQYGMYLGNLIIRFFEDGSYSVLSYELIELNKLEKEDIKVKNILDNMRKERDIKYADPIVHLPERLDGERETINVKKSNLASLITEAYYNQGINSGYNVLASITNGWGIRGSLEKGNVYFGDLVKVLPFSKRLLVVEIKGSDLIDSLEKGTHPQYYGIKKEDEKYKININNNWHDILDNENYLVVTNSFVWSGKDNYDGFNNSKIIADIGLDVDVFTDYLKTKYGVI